MPKLVAINRRDVVDAYRAMAADEGREREAAGWAENLIEFQESALRIMPSEQLSGKIGPGGRPVIPAPQRREFGLEIGDEVLLETAGDELRVSSLQHRIARIQPLVRRHNPSAESLSESLIRDRRAEAMID
jgi:bifunctional DNA-binding transcriptional regulator/antitoxin component of YhaV-PrlF toxin-antitoxin module